MDVGGGTVDAMTKGKTDMDKTERKRMRKLSQCARQRQKDGCCNEKKLTKIQAGCSYVGDVHVLCFARSLLWRPGGQAPGACHLGLFQVVKA